MPALPFDLAFVDGISATAAVRLNLNVPAGWSALADGTNFDPPPLSRAIASTLLADGAVVTAAAYDNRTITLALELAPAPTMDQAATLLQNLAREVDRPANFLRYQLGTTAPVFFRTLRSAISPITWDAVMRRATVVLLAEPFGYGIKETISTATPAANPATGMSFDVTGVKGDVAAPLNMVVTAADVIATGRRKSAIAVRRRGTPSAGPFVLQAESMTMSIADTTVQANNASFSGAGSNFVRTTFATSAAMSSRVQAGPFPASASVDARGTYRVYVRVRQNTAADVIAMRLMWGGDATSNAVVNPTVTLPADTGPSAPTLKYVDLGMIQIPHGYDVVEDFAGVAASARGLNLFVQAQRVSGSGSLDTDVLLFVPADDRLLLATWPETSGPTDFVVDSDRGNIYARGASGETYSTQPVDPEGGFPLVSPGVTNRIYFLRDVGLGAAATGAGDTLTGTTTINANYFPRYMQVRPPTT